MSKNQSLYEEITVILGQELKRDLMKLVKVDKAYSEMSRKTKAVPVRPGLALGVITLQVGKFFRRKKSHYKKIFSLRSFPFTLTHAIMSLRNFPYKVAT